MTELSTDHGGIRQRWLLVYSEQAYKRESKTLDKRIQKEKKALEKLCSHASKNTYGYEQDARHAALALDKKQKFHRLDISNITH